LYLSFIEATVLIGGENQVAAEGTIRELHRLANHVSCRIGPCQRHDAEPTGIRDRCRQFGHRHHRRQDNRLLNPEQFADRRSHHCTWPLGSRSSFTNTEKSICF